MGICDSILSNKRVSAFKKQNQSEIKDNNEEEKSIILVESDIKEANNSSTIQEIENNKCPQLDKYDITKESEFTQFNNKTHKTQSIFSSGVTDEEVIIRGEINKNCKNKEEDFDNNSFKKLVKNNGGIIIKNEDMHNNNNFDFNKENISEMKSKHSFPFMTKKGYIINNKLGSSWSNISAIKNSISENNKNIINYSINKSNLSKSNTLSGINNINFSIRESYRLTIPEIDEPLPNIDELSNESPFHIERNSLVSE